MWARAFVLRSGRRPALPRLDDEPTFRHRQVSGDPRRPPFLFLHGRPGSWQSSRQIMTLASPQVRAIAIDLPVSGGSTGAPTDGSKAQLAAVVNGLVENLGRRDLTRVGQDVAPVRSPAATLTCGTSPSTRIPDAARTPGCRDATKGLRSTTFTVAISARPVQDHRGDPLDLLGRRTPPTAPLTAGLVPGAGHFTQEEAPEDTGRLTADLAEI